MNSQLFWYKSHIFGPEITVILDYFVTDRLFCVIFGFWNYNINDPLCRRKTTLITMDYKTECVIFGPFWCSEVLLRVNVEFQNFCKANKNGTVFISSTKGPLVSTLDVTKSREKWKKKMEEASKSAKTTLFYAMSLNSFSTKTGKISETSKFNWSMQKLH